ncbi:hypothetical protein [Winogradskyella epiphytica]|uniref:hypothetical protein n=1 Tax=Winogradskyella epiphytica TaxID=262005 RepID=UPI000D7C59D3|nr:hypothetical protein [Winogradskyella epiphytica]
MIFASSCDSKKISFFQGQYFKANQELELNLNDGDYVYKKKFNENYSVGNLELVKYYKPKTDSVKIYLKVSKKDTVIFIPSTTEKVLFGNDAFGNLFIYTEKDTSAWLVD